MSTTDPVAEMLTSVRNAIERYHPKVVVQHSTFKEGICTVLKEEGFITDYKIVDDPKWGSKKRSLHIYLKYGPDREKLIRGIERQSKPGRRIFVGVEGTPRVLDGLGIVILSTSKGVLSSRRAKALRTGGELICKVW